MGWIIFEFYWQFTKYFDTKRQLIDKHRREKIPGFYYCYRIFRHLTLNPLQPQQPYYRSAIINPICIRKQIQFGLVASEMTANYFTMGLRRRRDAELNSQVCVPISVCGEFPTLIRPPIVLSAWLPIEFKLELLAQLRFPANNLLQGYELLPRTVWMCYCILFPQNISIPFNLAGILPLKIYHWRAVKLNRH